jgi:hypothetical protein
MIKELRKMEREYGDRIEVVCLVGLFLHSSDIPTKK